MKRIILSALAALAATTAHAADIDVIPNSKPSLYVHGDIDMNDGAKLQKIIDMRKARKIPTLGIVLNSTGGNVKGAWDMAAIIERNHMIVGVPANGYCASACMLMFAAGSSRIVSPHSYLGVHNASDMNASSDSDDALKSTQAMMQAFEHFGVPFQVTRKMVATPGTQSSWLNASDIMKWPNTSIITDNAQ